MKIIMQYMDNVPIIFWSDSTVIFNLGYTNILGGMGKHLTSIKMKHRNCLNLEPSQILTPMKIRPQIEVLACQIIIFNTLWL
jgi:hypothetical protein